MKSYINKGWSSYEEVFFGLDEYPDGRIVIWKGFLYKISSHYRSDGVRCLGLSGLHEDSCNKREIKVAQTSGWCVACKKHIIPKRNEPCICGSGKKYKKCCLN